MATNKLEVKMAVIENRMTNIETTTNSQHKLLEKIDLKLDNVIKDKADKTELKSLNDKVTKWTYGAVASLLIVLGTMVWFLIKFTLFNGG